MGAVRKVINVGLFSFCISVHEMAVLRTETRKVYIVNIMLTFDCLVTQTCIPKFIMKYTSLCHTFVGYIYFSNRYSHNSCFA